MQSGVPQAQEVNAGAVLQYECWAIGGPGSNAELNFVIKEFNSSNAENIMLINRNSISVRSQYYDYLETAVMGDLTKIKSLQQWVTDNDGILPKPYTINYEIYVEDNERRGVGPQTEPLTDSKDNILMALAKRTPDKILDKLLELPWATPIAWALTKALGTSPVELSNKAKGEIKHIVEGVIADQDWRNKYDEYCNLVGTQRFYQRDDMTINNIEAKYNYMAACNRRG
jgi:hypothetical protein